MRMSAHARLRINTRMCITYMGGKGCYIIAKKVQFILVMELLIDVPKSCYFDASTWGLQSIVVTLLSPHTKGWHDVPRRNVDECV